MLINNEFKKSEISALNNFPYAILNLHIYVFLHKLILSC
jgi:hypothetical protein